MANAAYWAINDRLPRRPSRLPWPPSLPVRLDGGGAVERMASPIAFLVGRWHGSGRGEFPTMDPFTYDEEVRFPTWACLHSCTSNGRGRRTIDPCGTWKPASGAPARRVSITLPRVTEISEG
jgi:hypothetical protein